MRVMGHIECRVPRSEIMMKQKMKLRDIFKVMKKRRYHGFPMSW